MNSKKHIENLQLTKSQLSIWMGQKLNPESPLYNMAHAFSLYGNVDIDVFKGAFALLVTHSDALRCVFYEEKAIPIQQIRSELIYDLEFLDFSSLAQSEIQDWLKQRSQRQFDLSTCLFDSIIIKVKEGHYIWFLNIHHLVTDATSSTILFGLMSDLYKRIKNENEDEIKLIPQFKAYINYEVEQVFSKKNESISAYWKEKVASLKTLPELYGHKNTYVTTKAKRKVIPLGKERSEKLRLLAQQPEIRSWTQDLTLFNMFASILFVYIYRVTGQNELSIGAPSHNRPTKTFKETPGIFIEFFPLITNINSEDTFFEVLQRVKLETNNYLRYAQPGMSNISLNKSYHTTLNFIKASFSAFDEFPSCSEWIHTDHIDSNHNLRCTIYDMDNSGELSVFLDLNEAVFNTNLSDRISEHFLKVLDGFLLNINQSIIKESIASISEYNAFLTPELKASNSYVSVIETFENQVKHNPNTLAIRHKKITLTYNELNIKANQLANYLIKEGIHSNDKIALYNYRNADYIIGVLAVIKLGGVFVPIASTQPPERVNYILANSNASLVLADTELTNNIVNSNVPVIDVTSVLEIINKQSKDNLPIKQYKNGLAYILYTSGSTGKPKGVLISNRALSNYLFWAKDYYEVSNKSIFALCTSISFDLTITSTFLPFLAGGSIVIYEEDSSGADLAFLDVFDDDLVNTIKLTPSHIALFKDRDLVHSKIETMIVGGEDFKVNLATVIQSSFRSNLKIFNEYGPTEATVGCIVGEFNQKTHNESSVPIGTPIKNMHAYILDVNKNIVPNGVVGDLYLSGHSLANGYLELADLTHNKFVDNPFVEGFKMYHTGDLARINNSGEFQYLGRSDEQVKIGGYRIELTDIESNLLDFEDIDNCAVLLIEGNSASEVNNEDKRLVGFYSGKNAIPANQLKIQLAKKLPVYMIPTDFKFLDELPLTKNGKVDKDRLKGLNIKTIAIETAYVSSRNEIDELIEVIWRDVLRLSKIGIHDNFIALGGNSLAAIRITSRINEELGMEIPLNKVFIMPTIETYSNYLEKIMVEQLNE